MIFDNEFENKVIWYDILKSSGIGYKLKFDLQYPLFKSKIKIILGYHINNTSSNHIINALIRKGFSSDWYNYTTRISYLYQNFCIGLQF